MLCSLLASQQSQMPAMIVSPGEHSIAMKVLEQKKISLFPEQ